MRTWYDIDACKGHPEVARWIEESVSGWPGVERAKCRSSTGRLQIDWSAQSEKDAAEADDISDLVRRFSLKSAYQNKKDRTETALGARRTPERDWRALDIDDVCRRLASHPKSGLKTGPDGDVLERIQKFGLNFVPPVPPRSNSEIFNSQLRNPSTTLLTASAAASLLTGGVIEAGVIIGIIFVNAGIGFATEQRAERALEKMSDYGPQHARALRGGEETVVSTREIVPGDILILRPATAVVADARLIESHGIMADEAILTGESNPVMKTARAHPLPNRALTESPNMVFKGSTVVTGFGQAIVVGTGMHTEAGRIQKMLGRRYQTSTRLQMKLEDLNRDMVALSLLASGLLFLMGLVQNQPVLRLVKTAISMAVAAVPEGLPMISTFTMSRAVSTLIGSQVLVRDLQSIETLGSIETLCLDKTGTLTQNRMTVAALAVPSKPEVLSAEYVMERKNKRDRSLFKSLLACAVLCNDAMADQTSEEENRGSGSPTESALLTFAQDFGLQSPRLRSRYERTKSEYRSEHRQYMLTAHSLGGGRSFMMMKGNPTEVLKQCALMKIANRVKPLTAKARAIIQRQNAELSQNALRVLGFAFQSSQHQGWIWLGLIGLQDPLRPGVKETLRKFQSAGVRTIMLTGDQAHTAQAIARQLGMGGRREPRLVDFSALKHQHHSHQELETIVSNADVLARVAPEDKREIIEMIRRSGRVVAMVGDGINDAPALKAAHLGVAIGQAGAEVAKEVAGIVLLDDRLDHLLLAASLGRAANASLRKSVRYLTSTNLSEMAVVLLQSALNLPETMDAMHLLWINLVTDTIPALGLAIEAPAAKGLEGSPQATDLPLMTKETFRKVVADVVLLSSAVLGSLLWGHGRSRTRIENQSLVLNTMTLGQILHALSLYSQERITLRHLAKKRPHALLSSLLGSLGAQAALIGRPRLREIFSLGSLSALEHVMSVVFALAGFAMIESRKTYV
jgi:Ca2+-transporting ATPase